MKNSHPRSEACRVCGRQNDCASNLFDERPDPPKAGDLHICINCGALSVYLERGSRAPTDAERAEAFEDRRLVDAIAFIHGRNRN